ncbi:MAG: hypothetical protein OEZ48_01085 [Candidatus Bathyarchaeota archaeon]|nr:hypothetical protein [Candidatus Bathyarchaeota archaeon]
MGELVCGWPTMATGGIAYCGLWEIPPIPKYSATPEIAVARASWSSLTNSHST